MGLLARWLRPAPGRATHDDAASHRLDDVTQREGILRVLEDLVARHALVTVHLAGDPRSYSSSLLRVEPSQGMLLMDELNPREGHALLMEQQRFRVEARMLGTRISFAGALAGADTSGPIAVYRVRLPARVRLQQRRAAFRAEAGPTTRIPVHLESLEGSSAAAILRDISVGGLGAEVLRRPLEPFEAGQRLPHCAIQPPDLEPIHAEVELRYIGRSRASRNLRVGARFIDPSPATRRAIRALVAQLDRRRARNRRTYERP
jgi:c-di-GMP-binding flagellar brake protein YcgR